MEHEVSDQPEVRVSDRTSQDQTSQIEHLRHVFEHASQLLPAQGPIGVFIHHNTLHAFEELHFDEAVQQGGRVFGCHPYLPEERYRAELGRGRILPSDLQRVLKDELGESGDEPILPFVTRYQLRLEMLQHPMRLGPDSELRWFVAVTDAMKHFRPESAEATSEHVIAKTRRWVMRDIHGIAATEATGPSIHPDRHLQLMLQDLFLHFGGTAIETWKPKTWEAFTLHALWRVCRDGVHSVKKASKPSTGVVRHRDLLFEATGEDTDLLVHEVLIRFCSTFLDQGFAHWHLPKRAVGFFRAFCTLYRQPFGSPNKWMRGLSRELARLEETHVTPLESVLESLQILGVHEGEWEHFLADTLLALRGWAGMILQIEGRGDRVAHPIPQGSLMEFLAIRLVLERLALKHVASTTIGFRGELRELRHETRARMDHRSGSAFDQRAFLIFQLAQLFGWSPNELYELTREQWSHLVNETESFSSMERRRVFHHAYERSFRNQTLDAIGKHPPGQNGRDPRPRFQVVCCIDDREESFRRHLEELAPDVETFGYAGFYGVAMYYRGTEDAHYVPLCPIVIRPQHWVKETVVESEEEVHRQRAKTRKALGTASHQVHVGSRSFTGGALLAAGLGILASIPLVGRIMFPRLTASVRNRLNHFVKSPERTRLNLERSESSPGPNRGQIGFSVDEMSNIVERTLRDIGMTYGMSRIVIVIGHGSKSLNNPHNSAYDCGACGGGNGGPNARAFAQMANDPRVRAVIATRGLHVPGDAVFIGGYHNTCNDSVTLFDTDRIPESHRAEFEDIRGTIADACDRNAHERCRRFQSAPLTLSFQDARRHVEDRSEDLAQTRPECGHATNAICVVGRRTRTKGLFLDRRAFLASYDPAQDDEKATILARILAAVVPVCAGINLEYYFSYVDNSGFGCGVKLPHNVTSLLGVMDGAASDLRTGLPWQMVEIHEPVRLIFVIETTPAKMHMVMNGNEGIRRLCQHDWIQLATLDPDSSQIHVFHNGEFRAYQPQSKQLPRASSSVDWYRGWRDHLEFAEIECQSS